MKDKPKYRAHNGSYTKPPHIREGARVELYWRGRATGLMFLHKTKAPYLGWEDVVCYRRLEDV